VEARVQELVLRSAFIDDAHLSAAHPPPLPAHAPEHAFPQTTPLRDHSPSKSRVTSTPPSAQVVRKGADSSEKVGVGISFKKDGEGFFYVMRMAPGGAAAATGLVEEGDRVVDVDGHPMQRATAQDLTRSILGLSGTWVTLLMRSADGKLKTVEICRSKGESESGQAETPQQPRLPAPATPSTTPSAEAEPARFREAENSSSGLQSESERPAGKEEEEEEGATGAPSSSSSAAAASAAAASAAASSSSAAAAASAAASASASASSSSVLLHGEAAGNVGLQLRWSQEDGAVCVAAVEAGGAAARSQSSVAVGDNVQSIDGVPLRSKSLAAVSALLSGPPGSTMELVLSSPASSGPPHSSAVRLTRGGHVTQAAASGAQPPTGSPQTPSDPAPAPQLAGIGVWLRKEAAGGYRVQRVTMRGRVGGTAEGGGVEVGDSVLEIDGAEVAGMAYSHVVSLLNGQLGSVVKLLLRKGEPDGRCVAVEVLRCTPPLALDPLADGASALAGVGIALKRDGEGYFFVKRVVDGSPAQRVGGIEVGDSIREIDGFSLFRKSLQSLHQLLHGRENSIVTLGVCDGDSGKMRQVEIPRGWSEDRADSDSGGDEEQPTTAEDDLV